MKICKYRKYPYNLQIRASLSWLISSLPVLFPLLPLPGIKRRASAYQAGAFPRSYNLGPDLCRRYHRAWGRWKKATGGVGEPACKTGGLRNRLVFEAHRGLQKPEQREFLSTDLVASGKVEALGAKMRGWIKIPDLCLKALGKLYPVFSLIGPSLKQTCSWEDEMRC